MHIHLSRRQRQILELKLAGHTNAQIASQLGLAEKTVHGHVGRLRLKLALDGEPLRAWLPRLRRALEKVA